MTRGLSRKTEEVNPPADTNDEDLHEIGEPRGRRALGKRTEEPVVENDDEVVSSAVERGWGSDKTTSSSSAFGNKFKTPTEETIIKLLENEPFAVFSLHWFDELEGKKSWVCLGKVCPLCNQVGDKPKPNYVFNVIDLTDPENPINAYWQVGPQVKDILKKYAQGERTRPLNREDLYWAVHRYQKPNKFWETKVEPIKARDLEDDWNATPLTTEELAEFEANVYDKELFPASTVKSLRDVAAKLNGED